MDRADANLKSKPEVQTLGGGLACAKDGRCPVVAVACASRSEPSDGKPATASQFPGWVKSC